jgi:hypothetical protein
LLSLVGGAGAYTVHLPPGALRTDRWGRLVFQGELDDATVEAVVWPWGWGGYYLSLEARGLDLDDLANPLTLTLAIGNDSGTTSVVATTQGQERRADRGR